MVLLQMDRQQNAFEAFGFQRFVDQTGLKLSGQSPSLKTVNFDSCTYGVGYGLLVTAGVMMWMCDPE